MGVETVLSSILISLLIGVIPVWWRGLAGVHCDLVAGHRVDVRWLLCKRALFSQA